MLAAYRKEFESLKVDPANPHMQCLAELFEPAQNDPLEEIIEHYKTLVHRLSGKKKDSALFILKELVKKNIKQ